RDRQHDERDRRDDARRVPAERRQRIAGDAGEHRGGEERPSPAAVQAPAATAHGRPQSSASPLALIGPAHLAISSATKCARYSGDRRSVATGAIPRSCSRFLTAGVSSARLVASLSLLTASVGALFGRKNAFQVTTS